MDSFLRNIFHNGSTPVRDAKLKVLAAPDLEVSNPLWEIDDALQDRTELQPPVHNGVWCDGSQCAGSGSQKKSISGLRYCCIDCPPDQTDFCSSCVRAPGQGIDHDPAHRLVRIRPTICALCEDVMRLELKEGDMFRGPYREFSALTATFKRVAEKGGCGFCAFVWSALAQCPVTESWPPDDNKTVTIRLRMPWANCYQVSVVADAAPPEDFEIKGSGYTRTTEKVSEQEKELEIYVSISMNPSAACLTSAGLSMGLLMEFAESAHQLPVGFGTADRMPIIARVQHSSASDETLHLARMWLQNCRDNHPQCSSDAASSSLPTRVIDLHGPDESRIYLRETRQVQGEYAALSYCWGPGSPGLFTTTGNVQSHLNDGVAIEDLPLTIRGALLVAEALGLRYLWIDRLCILQDSPEDWAHEAALMCDVYAGAALTLSADGSSSATEGLFRSQNLSDINYQPYRDTQGNDTPFLLVRPVSHPNLESRTGSNSQPISHRAWTMQEHLMSRRVLHFTSDELVWECNELTECECRRQSDKSSRALAPSLMSNMEAVYERWRMLVVAYTKRSISHETDKLPAFRGLVAKFQHIMANITSDREDEYLAGLWRGDFAAQLAWKSPSKADLEAFAKTQHHENTAPDPPAGQQDPSDWLRILRQRNKREDWHKSNGYIAPSWSWAHLNGPVSYLICQPGRPFKPYVDILEAEIVPRIANERTGQIASGFIKLRGFMVRDMALNIMYLDYGDNTVNDLSILSYSEQEFWIEFQPDDVQSIVRERGSDPRGLVLMLLGTKDWIPDKGAIVSGVSPPCRIERKAATSSDGSSETEAVPPSLPNELVEAFQQDPRLVRWSSYLVLAESKTDSGKYERLGCFDVWGGQELVMADLFVHSFKGDVTII
ncbi:Fc.00g071200.m01.CDS01 [Cosmosporella sp. VM-42]